MPRVNVTLTAEELAYVDRTRGRHSRSSRVAEIVAASMPVTITRRDGTDVIDPGGERYAVSFADGDAVLDGARLPSRSRP